MGKVGNNDLYKYLSIGLAALIIIILAIVVLLGNNNNSNNLNQSTTTPKSYSSSFTILNSGAVFAIPMPQNYYAVKFQTPPNAADIYLNNGSAIIQKDSGMYIQNETQYLNFIQNNHTMPQTNTQNYTTYYTYFLGDTGTGTFRIGTGFLKPNQTYYLLFMNDYADMSVYPAYLHNPPRNSTGIYTNVTITQPLQITYTTCPNGYLLTGYYCEAN